MLSQLRHTSFGQKLDFTQTRLSKRDFAILRFLTVVEQIERDIWQQYNELGGVTDLAPRRMAHQLALQFLDPPKTVSGKFLMTISTRSATRGFLSEVLQIRKEPGHVDLEKFRTPARKCSSRVPWISVDSQI